MTFTEFQFLKDGMYEFITYMDEKIIGIPYHANSPGLENCYIIPPNKMKEFNESSLSIEEKISFGLLIYINPAVIDECNKLK